MLRSLRIAKKPILLNARFWLAGIAMWAIAANSFAAHVEAKSEGVKIFSDSSKKSSVVKTLKKGDVLESIERQGMFWQVKMTDGAKGYVSILKVKRKAVEEEGGLVDAIREAAKEGRENEDGNGRQRSAVMGVRGLAQDENTEFAGNVKPNLRAVYFMEDEFVNEAQIESLGNKVFAEIEKKAGG